MQIRIRESGAVMYEAEFRTYTQSNGGPTWGQTTEEILDSLGADVVFEGPQATGGTVYQFSQADGVEQIDGKWYTKYVLGPVFIDRPATDTEPAKTAAEQEAEYKAMKDAEQAKSVRQQRGEKLKESDWTQVADAPVDQAAWAEYRQALRDVTAQSGFPWTIDWPVQP
jgi:outer membrane translocation and assembly module TamA